jgi:hypothetical protein
MATPTSPHTQSPFSGRRPISYSESHIHLPRIQSNLRPLLESHGSAAQLTIRESPSPPKSPPKIPTTPLPLQIESVTPSPELRDRRWIIPVANWTLRFNLHLVLIGLFETLFFWHFVSPSEDTALTGLVQSYLSSTLRACAALTGQQRTDIRTMLDLFINVPSVDAAATTTAALRDKHNSALLRTSWIYFGGLSTLFATLSAIAWYKQIPIQWRHLFAENLALIALLGCYEAMFFSTIAFQYDAVSMAELDRLVVDQIQAQC